MYQVDCMTKKLNVNFFKFMKENKKELNIDRNTLMFFKKNMKFTSKSISEQLKIKCPKINEYFNSFLNSNVYAHLMENIKLKNDDEYTKLFFKHVKNHQKLFNDDKIVDINNKNDNVNINVNNSIFKNNNENKKDN